MMKTTILRLCEGSNGYVTSSMLRERNIPSVYLTRLEKDRALVRVGRGVYALPDVVEDPFYIFHLQCPQMIFCKETALYLLDLSNRQFWGFEAVLPHNRSVPRMEGLKVSRSRSAIVELGASMVETPYGNKCRCYDRERSVCDLFVHDDYEYEDRAYAIREYARRYLDVAKLYSYARKLGVYDSVFTLFEALIWY